MYDKLPQTEPKRHRIHPVLHRALLDKDVPEFVKRLVFDVQASDPVNAASDARLLKRALTFPERDPDTAKMREQAFRVASKEWRQDLPPELANIAADKLVRILEEWADAELDAVI